MEANREHARQTALDSYGIVDTAAESFYDGIATLAASACDCPIALVSFVDRDRQWFKASLGMDERETPRDVAFCNHAIEKGELFVVENALTDSRFIDNSLVVGSPHIRFYAGEPFFSSDALPLGTVCVIDRKPRTLTDAQRRVLGTLAREVEHQLSMRRALLEAERISDQRGRFTAMFAHDLRSPLQVASMCANELLLRQNGDATARLSLTDLTQALQAMQRLVVDMLDLCASNAGQLRVRIAPVNPEALLAEIRAVATHLVDGGRRVEVSGQFASPSVRTDRDLVRRIAENLLGNALKYAPEAGHVELQMRTDVHGALGIWVSDDGPGVPEAERDRIFDPYVRLDRDRQTHARSGYGLGLPFCRVAARALGGQIWVESGPLGGAVFRVELPTAL